MRGVVQHQVQLIDPDAKNPAEIASAFVTECQEIIDQLIRMSQPYQLPEDYLSFLRFYGGLGMFGEDLHRPFFAIFGAGPATNVWYGVVIEPFEDLEIRQLQIAHWDINRTPVPLNERLSQEVFRGANISEYAYLGHLSLDLDVAGDVQQGSVLAQKVQIAAFAHKVEVFDSPAAYKATKTGSLLASKSFIPSGLLAVKDTPDKPPQAHAIIQGHILETEMRTTELASTAFHWALVQTCHITMDVVIDPELLNTLLRVNGVLAGSFWLSGRIVN